MNRPVTMILAMALVAQVACTTGGYKPAMEESPEARETGQIIAYVSWGESLLFVASDYRAEVAERWHIEDPKAPEWQVKGGHGQMVTVFVAEVPDTEFLDEYLPTPGDMRVRKGVACTGTPPRADDRGCRQLPENDKWFDREQTNDYGLGQSGRPEDRCDESYVQVGEWIYYSDQCQTEARRVAYHAWVCFP